MLKDLANLNQEAAEKSQKPLINKHAKDENFIKEI